jgi:hypothetical protein
MEIKKSIAEQMRKPKEKYKRNLAETLFTNGYI